MKTTNLVLVFALGALGATLGCSTAEPSMTPAPSPGDGDGGDGSTDGQGDHGAEVPPPKPLDATGKYALHSTFDLASNLPGTAGTVINTIIAATDDAADPTAWIVDQVIAQLPDGTVKTTLDAFKFLVVGYLNDRLLDFAPDFVSTVIQVGDDFGVIAKQFGLNETLELTRADTGYTAVHTITGAHFKLGNQELDFALTSYHMANVVVNGVTITMDQTGQLTIAAHDIPLAYGQLLRMGLDAAIIPLIDPEAHDLGDLLTNLIDCDRVGTVIVDAIEDVLGFPIGSASAFAGACTTGIRAGSAYVYSKIDDIDGTALKFGLSGSARGTDKNKDRNIDTIQTGSWTGTLSYGSTPTPLVPATFSGERM